MEHCFPDNSLLVVTAGSRAYGTHTLASDTDYRGIISASREMLVGLRSWDDQFEASEPDVVLYTLPKFVKLAMAANPNILDALFAADDCVVLTTPVGTELRGMSSLFLSKRAFATFGGYAHHQLLEMRRPGGRHGAHRDRVERYGYDTKHASHVVRLYRMCHEILTEGIVRVRRPDADELLAIKNGAWSIEQIESYASEMDAKCKDAFEKTSLPDQPDSKTILEWLMTSQERMLGGSADGV